MPHSIEYDPQTDIIYIRADGQLTLETVREITNAVALLAKEKGCFRVLNDLHQATMDLSILDVYHVPRLVTEIMSALDLPAHKFRRAVILPGQWKLALFYETISKNRVQNVALFEDIERARQWLLER